MNVLEEALETCDDRCHPVIMYNPRHYESTVQQGFRYRVLLATKSRRNHRQRAKRTAWQVGDDASAASGSAIV
ncbi:hypothetical protein TNCV_1232871 [Trichonephila clavipes]|nr:hypothetical protein TNCV_1232871 [Trichonephila clavipes]